MLGLSVFVLVWLRIMARLRPDGDRVQVEVQDVRDPLAVRHAVAKSSAVFHLAAQVAVTHSLVDPLFDFEVNARGTLNVLEACRGCTLPPPLLFTSTNKVYGDLLDIPLDKLGPSIAMLPSADAAMVAFGYFFWCYKDVVGPNAVPFSAGCRERCWELQWQARSARSSGPSARRKSPRTGCSATSDASPRR